MSEPKLKPMTAAEWKGAIRTTFARVREKEGLKQLEPMSEYHELLFELRRVEVSPRSDVLDLLRVALRLALAESRSS